MSAERSVPLAMGIFINEIESEQQLGMPDVESPLSLKSTEQEQADELGYGLYELDSDMKLCAFCEAHRMSPIEISLKFGFPTSWIYGLRSGNEQYKVMVQRCLEYRAYKEAHDKSRSIDAVFNDQIRPSVASLIEIRDNPFVSAMARIKAATEFLDRASEAPKARKEVDERKTIISIPFKELQNMQRALIEQGDPEDLEIIELIKGEGFEDTDAGK